MFTYRQSERMTQITQIKKYLNSKCFLPSGNCSHERASSKSLAVEGSMVNTHWDRKSRLYSYSSAGILQGNCWTGRLSMA